MLREAVIASACRTPIGSFNGVLAPLRAPQLGSPVIKEAVKRAGIKPDNVDEVIMGCVLTAGIGQAPARQAAVGAGLPYSVQCLTVNKVCGSGLKSVMLGAQAIMCGDARVVVAGGMESMSNVPYLLERARWGYRMGHGRLIDGMVQDGLWDVYNDFHMGNAAEICSKKYNISREDQDKYAIKSYRKALDSIEKGRFRNETVQIEVMPSRGKPYRVQEDEEPGKVKFEKIQRLKPAFDPDGTVTAANSSSLNDGAAALVIMSGETADEIEVKPIARIVGQASWAMEPEWFTTAPAYVIQKLLKKTGYSLDEIDLFEVNEAFAVVAIAVRDILGIPDEKYNVNGGAVALGHPIGASGARILTTLLHAMSRRNARRGIAAVCIGGGEASAVLVER
ncbi:MAG: thiolase family protein [Fidelibacterota bacterium]